MVETLLPAVETPRRTRRPALGYALAAGGSLIAGVNGSVSKVVLQSGIGPERLSQLRSLGAFAVLAIALLLARPQWLRLQWRDVPFLLVYGLVGYAAVQFLYFVAITRLPVGIALLLEYTAPVLVVLWVRFVRRHPVRRRMWGALALALGGLALVAQVWDAGGLDTLGVAAGLGAAAALASYYLLGEHGVGRRDPVSLSCWGFGVAAVAWSVAQPPWAAPWGLMTSNASLRGHLAGVSAPMWLLLGFIVVAGTALAWMMVVAALAHLPAAKVTITCMIEPVAASAVAWLWLGEVLSVAQMLGGFVVLAGIVAAQTAR